jgi:toxin HigB-1
MIRSFADRNTEAIFHRYRSRYLPPEIHVRAKIKLLLIDTASSLDDLRVPPGNRLETLQGRQAGQWSIRINQQWRICFEWKVGDAWNVEIVDYHR